MVVSVQWLGRAKMYILKGYACVSRALWHWKIQTLTPYFWCLIDGIFSYFNIGSCSEYNTKVASYCIWNIQR